MDLGGYLNKVGRLMCKCRSWPLLPLTEELFLTSQESLEDS